MTPPLDSHSTTEPKPELLSAVSNGIKICRCRKMYAALCMHTFAGKKLFWAKRTKPLWWGGGKDDRSHHALFHYGANWGGM